MIDEKTIEWLMKIKEQCKNVRCKCEVCKYSIYDGDGCKALSIIDRLIDIPPHIWDMEEIERIIRL